MAKAKAKSASQSKRSILSSPIETRPLIIDNARGRRCMVRRSKAIHPHPIPSFELRTRCGNYAMHFAMLQPAYCKSRVTKPTAAIQAKQIVHAMEYVLKDREIHTHTSNIHPCLARLRITNTLPHYYPTSYKPKHCQPIANRGSVARETALTGDARPPSWLFSFLFPLAFQKLPALSAPSPTTAPSLLLDALLHGCCPPMRSSKETNNR